jgi:tripartite-type tricarboxylate transporter receptor subunit TctC
MRAALWTALAVVKLVHAPYKGNAPGTLSVIHGETDLMFSNIVAALPMSARAALKTARRVERKELGHSARRAHHTESGLPGFVVEQLYGLVAPRPGRRAVVERLNEEVVARMPTPERSASWRRRGWKSRYSAWTSWGFSSRGR